MLSSFAMLEVYIANAIVYEPDLIPFNLTVMAQCFKYDGVGMMILG